MGRWRFELAGLSLAAVVACSHLAWADGVEGRYRARDACCLYTWTGFYAGLNIGAVASSDIVENSGSDTGSAGLGSRLASRAIARGMDLGDDGFIGGGQAGYNLQVGKFVLGVETDIQKVLVDARFRTSTINADRSIDWLGTTRLRAGVLASPIWLVYATGGVAYGDATLDVGVRNQATIPAFSAVASSSTHVGWTVGGGTEIAMTRTATLKVEYLFFDLGDNETTFVQNYGAFTSRLTSHSDETGHIARFGVNWKF